MSQYLRMMCLMLLHLEVRVDTPTFVIGQYERSIYSSLKQPVLGGPGRRKRGGGERRRGERGGRRRGRGRRRRRREVG